MHFAEDTTRNWQISVICRERLLGKGNLTCEEKYVGTYFPHHIHVCDRSHKTQPDFLRAAANIEHGIYKIGHYNANAAPANGIQNSSLISTLAYFHSPKSCTNRREILLDQSPSPINDRLAEKATGIKTSYAQQRPIERLQSVQHAFTSTARVDRL